MSSSLTSFFTNLSVCFKCLKIVYTFSASANLFFLWTTHIFMSHCFPKQTSEGFLSSPSSLVQTWPTYHTGQPIFSPLHHKQIGLLHLCLDPDCISLLIPHRLNILSSSLRHLRPIRHPLSLHVCPRCSTAFTCQDWIPSLSLFYSNTQSPKRSNHLCFV